MIIIKKKLDKADLLCYTIIRKRKENKKKGDTKMKTFKAKVTRGECEVQYIVRAEDKDAAAAKLFQISGERKLKITEV